LGVAHRDLKVLNVFVDANGMKPKIADFGLAVEVDPKTGVSLVPLQVQGTPAAMSPEQKAGGYYGTKCDVYAFGCIVYNLYTEHWMYATSQYRPFDATLISRGMSKAQEKAFQNLIQNYPNDRPTMATVAAAGVEVWGGTPAAAGAKRPASDAPPSTVIAEAANQAMPKARKEAPIQPAIPPKADPMDLALTVRPLKVDVMNVLAPLAPIAVGIPTHARPAVRRAIIPLHAK
jgi:serine/threonine-protein kinase